MVAQLSLITSILLASSTTTTSSAASTSTGSASQSTLTSTITSSGVTSTITSTISPSSAGASSGAGTISAFSSSQNKTALTTGRPQTTVSLFNACSGPGSACDALDSITYYGAVISADKTKTIYALDCATGDKNQTECWSSPMTVTQGPSMFARIDDTGKTPITVSCDITDKTKQAVCKEKQSQTAGGSGSGTTVAASATGLAGANSANGTVSTATLTFAESQIHYNALVITKGADKLTATSGMATNTPQPPTSANNPATSPTKKSAAGLSVKAPAVSLAGAVGIAIALFAF